MATTRNFLPGYDQNLVDRAFTAILPNYLLEVEKEHLRNFPFMKLVEKHGSIKYNCGGNGISWGVKARPPKIQTFTGNQRRNYSQNDPLERAFLPWGGHEIFDTMTLREKLIAEASGPQMVANLYGDKMESLGEDLKDQMGPEYFTDGSLPGNEDRWHGVRTAIKSTAQTLTVTDGVPRTADAADIVWEPGGTYAGLDMSLGAYGGNNESGKAWPYGNADREFDFYTPLVVNPLSTSFNSDNHTFVEQGEEAISWTINQIGRHENTGCGPNYAFAGRGHYEDLKVAARQQRRFVVGPTEEMRELGYGNRSFTISDGIQVINEYTIDERETFFLNPSCIEIRCVTDRFLVPSQFEVPEDDREVFRFINFSQMKFKSPRHMGGLKEI